MKKITVATLVLIVFGSCTNGNRGNEIQEEIKSLQKSYDSLGVIQNNILKDSNNLK